jgi:hypothetical protein
MEAHGPHGVIDRPLDAWHRPHSKAQDPVGSSAESAFV